MLIVTMLEDGKAIQRYEADSIEIFDSGEIMLNRYTIPPCKDVILCDIISVPTPNHKIVVT